MYTTVLFCNLEPSSSRRHSSMRSFCRHTGRRRAAPGQLQSTHTARSRGCTSASCATVLLWGPP